MKHASELPDNYFQPCFIPPSSQGRRAWTWVKLVPCARVDWIWMGHHSSSLIVVGPSVLWLCFVFKSHPEVEDAELQQPRAAEENHESRDGKCDGRQERFAAEPDSNASRQALNARYRQWQTETSRTYKKLSMKKHKKNEQENEGTKRTRERQKTKGESKTERTSKQREQANTAAHTSRQTKISKLETMGKSNKREASTGEQERNKHKNKTRRDNQPNKGGGGWEPQHTMKSKSKRRKQRDRQTKNTRLPKTAKNDKRKHQRI